MLSPFECLCGNFILPEPASYVFFYAVFNLRNLLYIIPMTKPREKTREELTAEIEDSKKKIRQYENREKMLRQKLSREERRTRSHRLIVRGAVFESIVPEAKTMTDEEAADLLRLALTGEEARAYLKKRAEDGNAG